MEARGALSPRVYLASFPKAGTHLAETYLRQIAAPWTDRPWLGSFEGNAWTTQWVNIQRYQELAGKWPEGAYLKGHCGRHPDICEALWDGCVCVLFVYRDLRDVAVSAAHHVLDTSKDKDDSDRLKHPGKAQYQALATFEDVLIGIIDGLGKWPGLAERWALYRDWLDEKWTLPLRYENLLCNREETASLILRYVAGQTAAFWGRHMRIDRAQHDAIVASMVEASQTQKLVTYRRGTTGEWREYWTDNVAAVWRDSGAQAANEAIGYEGA